MDKIIFVPHPKLRQKAKTIIKVTQSEIDLSKKMVDVMLSAPGVGLAANQIGILKKIVTVRFHDEEKKKLITHMFFLILKLNHIPKRR